MLLSLSLSFSLLLLILLLLLQSLIQSDLRCVWNYSRFVPGYEPRWPSPSLCSIISHMFMCFILKNFFAQSRLGFAHPAYATLQHTVIYKTPLHRVRTLFTKQISRTRIDFSRALKFTLMLLHYLDFNVNSPYCLPYTSYLLQDNLVLSTGLAKGVGHSKEIQADALSI